MKYIIFRLDNPNIKPEDCFIAGVIFPDCVSHSQVKLKDMIPITAGFCKYNFGEYECFGNSESLNLKSIKSDEDILYRMKFSNYIFDLKYSKPYLLNPNKSKDIEENF